MKECPKLIKYTMYFDTLTNNIIFMQAWDNNEIIYYDEFPEYYTIKSQVGYALMDYLYLPFNRIQESLNDIINDISNQDFESVDYFLTTLYDLHPYYGFYLLKYHQFIDPYDFDELDCHELLNIILKDIKNSIYYCNRLIKPFLDLCLGQSNSYEKIYFNYIENLKTNRYFRNGELLDFNLYYKTTFESFITDNTEPIDEYSFYKICFNEYLVQNQSEINEKYKEAALKIKTEEDIYDAEYGFPFQTLSDENDARKGILPKKLFLQDCFYSYIYDNQNELKEKYIHFISNHHFQFVESITVDEGISVSIKNCLIFELVNMLKKHCKISICQNCGKMFPLSGDYNAKYCERTTNNLTCKVIANRKATQAKTREVPAIKLYMKYYKRYKGRVRISKITTTLFDAWNKQAKIKRDECVDGLISITDFQQWLDNYESNYM